MRDDANRAKNDDICRRERVLRFLAIGFWIVWGLWGVLLLITGAPLR